MFRFMSEFRSVIVLPAYNEEEDLERSVRELYSFLKCEKLDSDIAIADNNSKDRTAEIAERLVDELGILYNFVGVQGKGAAVKYSWLREDYDYDVYSFMDVDLATDLEAYPRLIEAVRGGSDIVCGSRYTKGASVKRQLVRKFVSFGYRTLFHLFLDDSIADPQCGFKAINREVRDYVLPEVESDNFFFDSELIVKAKKKGYSVREIPVKWQEKDGSSVRLRKVIPSFLKGMGKLRKEVRNLEK